MRRWMIAAAAACVAACGQGGGTSQTASLPPGLCNWPGLSLSEGEVEREVMDAAPAPYSQATGWAGGTRQIMGMSAIGGASCQGGETTALASEIIIVDRPFAEAWRTILAARPDLAQSPDGYRTPMGPYALMACAAEDDYANEPDRNLEAALEDQINLAEAHTIPVGVISDQAFGRGMRLTLAPTQNGRTAIVCARE